MKDFSDLKKQLPELTFDVTKSYIKPEAIEDYLTFYQLSALDDQVNYRAGYVSASHYSIFTQYWFFEDARATVMVVHGYYDHAGIYSKLIRWCLNEHYNVIVCDLPGHGLSSGPRAEIDSFDDYGQAVNSVLDAAMQENIKQPIYAIGQSTGAAVLMNMMWVLYKKPFAKMVFLSPLVKPASWGKNKIVFYLLRPWIKSIRRKFVKNSSDTAFLDFIKHEDPLQHDRLMVKWVAAMKQWLDSFEQRPVEDFVKPLVIQGEKDTTVDWVYNLKKIKNHFPKAHIVSLAGAGHHLVNEEKQLRTAVFSQIKNYFDQTELT